MKKHTKFYKKNRERILREKKIKDRLKIIRKKLDLLKDQVYKANLEAEKARLERRMKNEKK